MGYSDLLMRNVFLFVFISLTMVALLSGCWGEPKSDSSPTATGKEPPKSMAEKRSLDPVSTPIYAGEDAKAKIEKAVILKAIQGFQEVEGRNPASLQELADKHYLPKLPKEPVGYKYKYSPETGEFDVVLK